MDQQRRSKASIPLILLLRPGTPCFPPPALGNQQRRSKPSIPMILMLRYGAPLILLIRWGASPFSPPTLEIQQRRSKASIPLILLLRHSAPRLTPPAFRNQQRRCQPSIPSVQTMTGEGRRRNMSTKMRGEKRGNGKGALDWSRGRLGWRFKCKYGEMAKSILRK